jgi:hypothetical protein
MSEDEDGKKVPRGMVEKINPELAGLTDELTATINKHLNAGTNPNTVLAAMGETASRTFDAFRVPLSVVQSWTDLVLTIRKAELGGTENDVNIHETKGSA